MMIVQQWLSVTLFYYTQQTDTKSTDGDNWEVMAGSFHLSKFQLAEFLRLCSLSVQSHEATQ